MVTLSAQERGLQAQNTYKRRQISPFGVRKPVFFVEVRSFEATSEYTGWISEILMYQIVTIRLLDFNLLRTWAPGMLKTRGYPWICGSNGCRRAYFGLSMESKRPHKAKHLLRTVFTPPLVFWVGTEQEEGLAWFVNESETRGVTVGRRGLWHPL